MADTTLSSILEEALSLKVEDQSDTTRFRDLDDWDSMAFMFLITRIEDQFQVQLDNNQITEMQTIGDLKRILKGHGLEMNGL